MDKHDEETESKRECRICQQNEDHGVEGDAFISPCSCNGTHKFVHASCLIRWVQQDSINAYKCPVCTSDYYGCGVKTELKNTNENNVLLEPAKEAMFTASLYLILFSILCCLMCDSVIGFSSFTLSWPTISGRDTVVLFICVLWSLLIVFMGIYSYSVYCDREDAYWKIIVGIRRIFAPVNMLLIIMFLVCCESIQKGAEVDPLFFGILQIISYLGPLYFAR